MKELLRYRVVTDYAILLWAVARCSISAINGDWLRLGVVAVMFVAFVNYVISKNPDAEYALKTDRTIFEANVRKKEDLCVGLEHAPPHLVLMVIGFVFIGILDVMEFSNSTDLLNSIKIFSLVAMAVAIYAQGRTVWRYRTIIDDILAT